MPLEQVRVYEIGGKTADGENIPPVIVHDEETAEWLVDVRRRFQENHDIPVEESTLSSYTREEAVRDVHAIPGHPSAT